MANDKKSIAMVNCGNPPYNKIQEDINNMKPTTMKWIGNNIELNDMQGVHTFLLSFSVHDKFHRTLILSGFCLLKIAKISLNSSFFPKPIKR
ncbi:hypothetical protein ABLU22_15890, partial [Acinetobacter lwoffii]